MAHKQIRICDWCKKEKVNPYYWIEVSYRAWIKKPYPPDYPVSNHFDFCSNECMNKHIEKFGLEKGTCNPEYIMESCKG